MEKQQLTQFTLHVKRMHHPMLRSKLSERRREVTLHTTSHPGHIAPVEGAGLEYDYTPVPDKDEVEIKVTHNPHGLTGEQIKMELERALESLVS